MVWARVSFLNVNSPEYVNLRDTMRKYHVGGFGVTINVRQRASCRRASPTKRPCCSTNCSATPNCLC